MSDFTRGQVVRLDYAGQTVKATIELASSNGRSLMLAFDGALASATGGMYVGQIPLLWENGGFTDLAEGAPVRLSAWCDA